uniref:Glycosyltransferase 2-like domain-containing protein n=1 Tax=Gadus morhua TaxID=8049 RepID=A0A8C5D1G9_GADMO
MWTPPTGLVKPPASCTCPAKSFDLAGSIPTANRADIQKRRAEEYKKHQARTSSILNTLLFAQSNSPLQYPIQGFTVRPLVPTLIPGTVRCTSFSLLFQSVHFSFEHHEAVFPIAIRQPSVPVLFDMGTNVSDQVTITTKTFMRYKELKVLIRSLRQFYKDVVLVVADDSFTPENITEENVLQYVMPGGQGWFAGRTLAVSQVTTKYFLWVDDDFLFTEKTKIEDLVEVMEATPELDVVGGSVTGNQFYFSIAYEEGDGVTGGCMDRKPNIKFQSLPNYPQCSIVNGVVNFFLARTDAVNRVRFDPKLKRVAHSEFFMDGLGQLMVASCGHVSIGHQPKGANAQYGRFRHPGKDDVQFKLQLHYYKNHLQCIHYG